MSQAKPIALTKSACPHWVRIAPHWARIAMAGLLLAGCAGNNSAGRVSLAGTQVTPLSATAASYLPVATLAPAGSSASTSVGEGTDPSVTPSPYRSEVFSGSYLAGLYAGTVQDTRAAADFFAEALESDPDNVNLLRRTFILMLADGRIDETLALLNRYDDIEARGSVGRLARYLDALKKDQWPGAQEELKGISTTGFDALFGPLAHAWALMGEGHIDDAVDAVNDISDKPVFAPIVNYHIGLLNDLAGRPELAGPAYTRARKSRLGRSLRMVQAHGRFLERQKKTEDARSLYTETLRRLPANPILLAALERLDKGILPSRLVNRPEEGFAEALYTAASALAQDRAHESATIYLQLAVFARPDFELAYLLLARQFEGAGRWQDALDQYSKVSPKGPLGWEARFQIARNLDRTDRLAQATQVLEAMAAEKPNDPAPNVLLGDILRARETYAQAAKQYDVAISRIDKISGDHWILFYSRGVSYERTERWDLAEADFLRALELRPDQPLVLNYLGYSWIEKGLNIDKARKMVERAVASRPNDGYVVDSLGWALYKLGRYEEAVKHLERAVELRPQDPTINDHLGDVFWRVGRQIEARFQWRHALTFKPSEHLAKQVRAKIVDGLAADSSGG